MKPPPSSVRWKICQESSPPFPLDDESIAANSHSTEKGVQSCNMLEGGRGMIVVFYCDGDGAAFPPLLCAFMVR